MGHHFMSRGCLDKRRYTREEAKQKAHGHKQRAYSCMLCAGWHLTTSKKNRGNKKGTLS